MDSRYRKTGWAGDHTLTAPTRYPTTSARSPPRSTTPPACALIESGLLIRFMGEGDLQKMTLAAARATGCTPCRACLPDQAEEHVELGLPEPERQAEIILDVLRRPLRRRPLGSRTRTRGIVDREHLPGDQLGVLGQGRDYLRVVR
jgi:hypothetical protein